MSTLHEHLPVDILSAELGGTGPAFNPSLWADFVIHTAMEEVIKRDKEKAEKSIMNKRDNVENNSIVKNKYQQVTKNIPLIDINSESEKPSTIIDENKNRNIDNLQLGLKNETKNYIDNEKQDDEILDNDQRLKLPENYNENKDILTTESTSNTDFFNYTSNNENIWGPYEKNNSQDNLINNNQTIGMKTPDNQNKENSEEINLMT